MGTDIEYIYIIQNDSLNILTTIIFNYAFISNSEFLNFYIYLLRT